MSPSLFAGLPLHDILYRQGLGTRRQCAELVRSGAVQVWLPGAEAPLLCTDPERLWPMQGLRLRVQGREWPCVESAYVMLHKPAGMECSQRPSAWPSIYTLLPAPLRQRPRRGGAAGVQAVGRLDQDTTGLLLLTDDGQLLHRLASPRHVVAKVYDVTLKHPGTAQQVRQLLEGVQLHDVAQPVRAVAAELVDVLHLRLTLTEGRYHQVKRMVAAAGNRVQALHRSRFGPIELPPDLMPGQWRWLSDPEVAALRALL